MQVADCYRQQLVLMHCTCGATVLVFTTSKEQNIDVPGVQVHMPQASFGTIKVEKL